MALAFPMANSPNPIIDNYSLAFEGIKRLGEHISDHACAVLADMYTADELNGSEQETPVAINKLARISMEQGAAINQIMRRFSVVDSLEIGFCYGFSTIWILDALQGKQNAHHIAIDPFERTHWHGVGLSQAKRLEFGEGFEWVEDYSIHVLSDFIREKRKFDFVFIDGNHRFDDVIVDFYLADQVIDAGGIIALDDMWMPSIQKAVAFILGNRAYRILPQPIRNMAVLIKQQSDDRNWDHFIRF